MCNTHELFHTVIDVIYTLSLLNVRMVCNLIECMGMCCIVSKPSGSWHFLGLTHFLPSFRTFPTGQAQPGLQSLGQTGLGSSHVPVQGAHSKYFCPSISQAIQLCVGGGGGAKENMIP